MSRAIAVMTAADPELARIRALRRSIAERIEADIALLDALAGDPDLEADYCTRELDIPGGFVIARGRSTDDEPDADGEQDDEPEDSDVSEPSLGSLGGTAAGCTLMAQTSWHYGDYRDREEEHDGREPDEDIERDVGEEAEETNEDGSEENEYWTQPLHMEGGGYSPEAFLVLA